MPLTLLAAVWTLFQVNPYAAEPYSPDAAPREVQATNRLVLAAAQGEIEAASFLVCPAEDLARVDFVPTALRQEGGGGVIGAEALDFRVVKRWWRSRDSWRKSYNWQPFARKEVLLPELLLHDDGLVRVDEGARRNLLRFDYPEGPQYLDVSDPEADESLNDDLEPVRDAVRFVPTDLVKGLCRQFWLKVEVPEAAKPGRYEGTVRVISAGNACGEFGIVLTVHPFRLPLARAHYDSSREFRAYVMNHDSYGDHLKQGKDPVRAAAKVLAIYRNMREHNAHPGGFGEVMSDSPDDPGVRGLALAQQAGLSLKPVYSGMGADPEWIMMAQAPSPGKPVPTAESDPALFAAAMTRFRERFERQVDVCRRWLGHADLVFTASDEGTVALCQRQFPFWEVVQKGGCRIFATAGDVVGAGWMIDQNDISAAISPYMTGTWHLAGGEAYSYGATFLGAVGPDHYRRDKGLRMYYADFDGLNEYVLYEPGRRWNDFTLNTDQYMTLGIVYPMQDGVIDTLAWEAFREGQDDVRYLSLLRLRAEAAMASKDPELVRRGRVELAFLESRNPERIFDLDAFRSELVGRIVALPACQEENREAWRGPEMKLPPFRPAVRPPKGDLKAEVSSLLERHDKAAALALVRAEIQQKGNDRRVRGALLLEEAQLLARPVRYREKITKVAAQRAAAAYEEAKADGASGDAVCESVLKALLASGECDRLLSMKDSVRFRSLRVRAHLAKGEYQMFRREYAEYCRSGCTDGRLELLKTVVRAAARQSDALLAAEAWQDLLRALPPGTPEAYREQIRQQAATWSGKARKAKPAPSFGSDDEQDLTLDEF